MTFFFCTSLEKLHLCISLGIACLYKGHVSVSSHRSCKDKYQVLLILFSGLKHNPTCDTSVSSDLSEIEKTAFDYCTLS